MIVDSHSYDQLRAQVSPVLAQWHDQVIPGEVELLPHSTYSPAYAWMFAYEKSLKYRIEKALGRPIGHFERRLFGPDGVFSEALSNAFVHGHRRNPSVPIDVWCTLGSTQLAFSIRDRGKGFDVDRVVGAAIRGYAYASYGGNGLKALAGCNDVVASYSDRGRCLAARLELAL